MAIHYSDDLPRLKRAEAVPTAQKTQERSKLQEDIDAYLAAGGEITQCGTQSGVHYPIRQTKKALVNFLKRRSFERHGEG